MKKDDRVFLSHILDEIGAIEEATRRGARDDAILERALVRCLEIIGEATSSISSELKEKYPAVPWQDMKDMRNKLIHEYFGVSMDMVWQVVDDDLPDLKQQIITILHKLEQGNPCQ